MVYSQYFTTILVRYVIGIWKLHTAGYTRVNHTTQLTEALKDDFKVRQALRSILAAV